ncbi:MAG TPA: conjugal transfer pilus assembly protein TraU [Alphaproteobacteria bacterium]|nr:conjugal transfer pilus assembly protein TraU [Alphaproteobacteria bacterium]
MKYRLFKDALYKKRSLLKWVSIKWDPVKRTPIKKVPVKRALVKQVLLTLFLLASITKVDAKICHGRFVNPITDICWSCLFPISIGPIKVSTGGRQDTPNPSQIPCMCERFPYVGIPVGFWEPARLVDVTRVPFCMVSMGGIQLGKSKINYGVHGATGERRTQNSFYQVHWYVYPVIYWLELLVDFICLETGSFDVGYITELDPLWNADELSFILNPEAVLFGNPIAQAACAADCAAATAGFPIDALFWCGGCQGSLYPFTGNNAAHNGGVQASLLMAQRMMAKLHRELLLWGTSGTSNHHICQKYPLPIIKKTQYKTQMTYPRPTTRGPMACNPLGRTEVVWGSGREFPYKGEDFGYLIWRKKNCCAL